MAGPNFQMVPMRLPVLFVGSLLALGIDRGAATPVPRVPFADGAVTGMVFDSLSLRPLARAMVQLVSRDDPSRFSRGVYTDSAGFFAILEVPAGNYRIGFQHPMLDSLSLEPVVREIVVGNTTTSGVRLATPSWATIRTAICGSRSGPGAVVLGTVRDPRTGAPVRDVSVQAEWTEFSVTRQGFARRVPHKSTTTGESGGYAFCGVPSPGLLAIVANRGADSTDQLEVRLPADELVRRDLFLRSSAAREGARSIVTGVVLTEEGGRPIPNAEVRIGDAPEQRVRTNAKGEFSIASAPMGTRMLQARAMGFVPNRVAVDVVPELGPLMLHLSTFKTFLDTVRVTGRRLNDSNMKGFEQRRLTGAGRYITAADIERRNPLEVTDMLKRVPGVMVDRGPTGTNIMVRGMFSGYCSPTIYVNGMTFWDMQAEELETFARPDEIAGIEIYNEVTVPPQFSRGMAGSRCGAILIWTK